MELFNIEEIVYLKTIIKLSLIETEEKLLIIEKKEDTEEFKTEIKVLKNKKRVLENIYNKLEGEKR